MKRRTLLRTVAWTAPVAIVSVTAPAIATSDTTCPIHVVHDRTPHHSTLTIAQECGAGPQEWWLSRSVVPATTVWESTGWAPPEFVRSEGRHTVWATDGAGPATHHAVVGRAVTQVRLIHATDTGFVDLHQRQDQTGANTIEEVWL